MSFSPFVQRLAAISPLLTFRYVVFNARTNRPKTVADAFRVYVNCRVRSIRQASDHHAHNGRRKFETFNYISITSSDTVKIGCYYYCMHLSFTSSSIFELTVHERQSLSVIATVALRFRTEAGRRSQCLLPASDAPYPFTSKRCKCSKKPTAKIMVEAGIQTIQNLKENHLF